MQRPFSAAADRNKMPILACLKEELLLDSHTLEIGSGTGQHADFFTQELRGVNWTPSERREGVEPLRQGLFGIKRKNLFEPLLLDLSSEATWPDFNTYDNVFTANTLHIVSLELCKSFFKLAERVAYNGKLFIYGPFNYDGHFTSESNAEFDLWLKNRNPESGIRDIEKVLEWAGSGGFKMLKDMEMPANNRLLIFEIDR